MKREFYAFYVVKDIIILIRPHQWIKNLFIFAPFFFSFDYSFQKFMTVSLGFVFFCFAASAIYIFNDYHDIAEDREHPEKRNRPLASGNISKLVAILLMIIFLCVAFTGATLLSRHYLLILGFYVIMNLLYTIKLKHIAILDIGIVATGFVLRIFAGADIMDVEPSMWIVILTFLLALFLALAKRRDDCLLAGKGMKTRKNIDGYNLEMINLAMAFMAGVTVVAYIMYTTSPEIIKRAGSARIYFTALFVIIGILRYMQLAFVKNNSGNPTKIVSNDRFLQVVIILWLLSFWVIHHI